jgi:hypothetical protein
MKIRIKGNSLRYRLTRTDIDRFATEGYLEELISFGDKTLVYAIQSYNEDELTADFKENKITLLMPDDMVKDWASTEKVGFENNHAPLYLLVEKDFKCLDNVAEDQSDNYPNPLAKKA